MKYAVIVALALTATSAAAEEMQCEGPFAIDTSEARLIEAFGADNVQTRVADGPEGTTMIKTFIYPDDPERTMEVAWWNEEDRTDMSFVTVPPGDTAPGGLQLGMSIEEVEALNGKPFTLMGFGWDYGGGASFQGGEFPGLPEGCFLSLGFSPSVELPAGTDQDAIMGDREVASDLPLLRQVEPVIDRLSFGYPHPDFR
jgi:hypothetical protein